MSIFSKSKLFNRFLPLTLAFFGLLIIAGGYFILKSDKPAEAAWYNSSWTYRKPITIDKNKVATSTALTNFPVLISVTDTDLKYTSFGGKVGKTDGTDILFTSSDGSTKLYHEIEKYSSSTGETIIWVQVPSLSGSSDTTLYIYFGNSGASDQQAITSTWDSNYKLVWHMAQYWDDNSIDSTSNNNDGVNASQISSDQATGKIGGTVKFRGGGGAYYTVTDNASLNSTTNITTSMWYRRAEPSTSWPYMWENGTSGNYWMLTKTNAHKFTFTISGVGDSIGNTDVDYGQWHLLTAVKNGDSGTNLSIYVDGVLDKTFSIGALGAQTGNKRMIVGDAVDTWIDEFRISDSARTAGWVKTEYNNQSDPGSFYAYGSLSIQTVSSLPAASATGVSWYNSSWGYRKQITINKNQVASSSLSNFPMLFSVTDSELKYTSHGGKVGKTDGTDILFTSSNGTTKLDHEIEKYSSSTGETIIWVEIPTLSGTSDTPIYMYFGNSGASDQQAVTATWESNFKGVYHLKDGTTLSMSDSSTNLNTGTNTGSTAAAGMIDGGANFAPLHNRYISLGTNATTSVASKTQYTFSAWVKFATLDDWQIFYSDATSGNWWRFTLGLFATDCTSSRIAFMTRDASTGDTGSRETICGTAPKSNVWYYYSGVYDSVSGVKTFYINGLPDATTSSTVGAFTATASAGISIGESLDAGYTFGGYIDEVRVAGTARSAGWIKTEYNNQSDPGSFYAYGALQSYTRTGAGVEVAAAASGGGSWYNASWGYRKQITVDKNKVATSSSLSNFPMLFSVTDSELKYTSFGGRVGKTDGTDILFTSSDGTTKLSHEIEKYSSSTGETIIWVKIPTLSGTSDTSLYMYYGNSGASDQQDINNVWDSSFLGVYHLGEARSTSANNYRDSTSNVKHATLTDGDGDTIQASGQIGSAVSFSGDGDLITTGINNALTDFTVCVWQYDPSVSLIYERIIDKNYGGGMWIGRDGNYPGLWGGGVLEGGAPYGRFVNISDATWKYICSRRGGTTHTILGNGGTYSQVGTVSSSATDTTNVRLGANSGAGDASNATIDEVRVSTVARGNDWIMTEYNSMSNPSGFYAYGATQTSVKSGAGGTGTAPAVKVRGQVKFR